MNRQDLEELTYDGPMPKRRRRVAKGNEDYNGNVNLPLRTEGPYPAVYAGPDPELKGVSGTAYSIEGAWTFEARVGRCGYSVSVARGWLAIAGAPAAAAE